MANARILSGAQSGAPDTKVNSVRPTYFDSMTGSRIEDTPNVQFDEFRNNVLEKLKNSKYSDLAALNPYATYDYSPTLWDAFGNLIGFNTKEDEVRMDYQKAAREYDAQLMQLQFENSYNSEQAKAERMRAAGENPDLIGTSGVDSAGEFAQEQTSPDASPGNLSFMDFSNVLMNALSGTLNIMNTFNGFRLAAKDLELKDAELAGKDIQNINSLVGLAAPFVESVLGHYGVAPSAVDFIDGIPRWHSGKNGNYEIVAGPKFPYFKRYGKYNDFVYNSVTRSLKTAASVYAQQSDLYKNRASVLGYLDPDKKFDYKGSNPLTDFDDTLRGVFGELAKGSAEVMKSELLFKHGYYKGNSGYQAGRAEFQYNKYLGDYWSNMSGSEDAKLHGLKRITEQQKAEMAKRINKVYYNVINTLSAKAENGKLPAALTLVGLGSLLDTGSVGSGMLGRLPSLPSFMKR